MKEEEEPKKEPIDVPRKYCLVTAMKTHSSSGRSYRPPMVEPGTSLRLFVMWPLVPEETRDPKGG